MPYKRGRKWVAQVRKHGRRKERIFPTRKQALAWEAEMREKSVADWNDPTGTTSLGDWANAYLDFARAKYTIKTYKEKRMVFRLFFSTVDPALPATDLTPGMVLSYLKAQAERRSGHAANKDRKNLVAAWNWGMKYLGLPVPNPCLVDRFPEARQVRYVPPERDFWTVYDAAEEGQDKIMLLAYLHTAARRAELFRLKWDDVDFGGQRIRLSTRKRQDGCMEHDWLPMSDDLFNALLPHRQRAVNQWVFPNPETGEPYVDRKRWMRALCNRAGVKPFGIHAIRHLTASILARSGVPGIQIQAILRHKKLSTTERYLHRLADLRPALRVLAKNKKPSLEPSEFGRKKAQETAVLKVV